MDQTEIVESDKSGVTGLKPLTSGSQNVKFLPNQPTGSGLMNYYKFQELLDVVGFVIF